MAIGAHHRGEEDDGVQNSVIAGLVSAGSCAGWEQAVGSQCGNAARQGMSMERLCLLVLGLGASCGMGGEGS